MNIERKSLIFFFYLIGWLAYTRDKKIKKGNKIVFLKNTWAI